MRRTLFRYRSFNTEKLNDYSYIHQRIINIEKWKFEAFEGLVYPSSPLYFNDPYDCEFCFQSDALEGVLDRETYIHLLERRFSLKQEEKNRILYSDNIERAMQIVLQAHGGRLSDSWMNILQNGLNDCMSTIKDAVRVVCLSEVYDSIADITTDTAWLYTAIAKYLIIEKYSAYDVISEIPVEGNESRKTVSTVKRLLKRIEETIDDEQSFGLCVTALAEYLGYDTRPEHIDKLFKTISDTSFHVAFEADKYKHIAITFHSSKGLEFEQVIVFAEDYRLSDMSSIYNHYVAVTRAKSKLIIVKLNNYNANCFHNNLQKIFSESGRNIEDVVLF